MEIITDIDRMLSVPTAATIGSFDGVHRGHAAMIAEAHALARQRDLPLSVLTFARHPRQLFSGCDSPFLLTSTEDKTALLEAAGVERCILLDFDAAMAALTAREFMHDILHTRLGVRMLAVGYDHRFGRPQAGEGLPQYIEYGREVGIEVVQMARFAPDGEKISSSKVRGALASGDVAAASRLLARPYSVAGHVVHGAAIGRRLGFPTANIQPHEPLQMLPLDGVYECVVHVDGMACKGVMNIGCKPTLSGTERTLEAFLIDFDGDIYGADVRVDFVRRLRGERRFAGLDDLRAQIAIDVERVVNGLP